MIHSLQTKGAILFIITVGGHLFFSNSQRVTRKKPNFERRQRVAVDIGEFPNEDYGPIRRQIRPGGENGDVYEFHRFQHYGFKTPSPNTFSLESMLAFLAPLATIPIIASAALSSLATILPTLTTDGMVKGRSKREVILESLDSMPSFNYSTWKSYTSKPNITVRNVRDLDVIHKYLKQMDPKEDYHDEVMASYLQCSGMLSLSNHCLERLTCQFSDGSSRMDGLEKEVSSLIIFTILNNKYIGEEVKEKMRRAAFFGRDNNGRCGHYACSRTNFRSL